MHEHDVEGVVATPRAQRQRETAEGVAPTVGKAAEAGRTDTLSASAVLHLQRAAGNAGVRDLVLQRREDQREDDHTADEERSPVKDVVASRGTPLEAGVRASMESALGHDFGDVEVHTDASASASASAVQAHAYTVANHVVFGEGRYEPESPDGRRTLAHELTHVVQQRSGPVEGTPAPGGIRMSHPTDRHEQEAAATAERIAPSGPQAQVASSAAPAVQRDAATDEQVEDEEPPVSKLDVQRDGEEEVEEEAPA